MKNLFKKYNTLDTLIVISSYPKKQEIYSKGVCAVASFTKNTIRPLIKKGQYKKIVVLTMIVDKEEVYEEDGILVVRCFKRNNPLSYFSLLKKLLHFSLAKRVLIEFEFASFGDTKATLAILPLIWSLFFLGKNVTLVIHQVVIDLQKLSGHIGINSKELISLLFNPGLKLYYKLLSFPVSSIIVLEDSLKESLSTIVNKDKITVIPHGVPIVNKIFSKNKAKQKLGAKNEVVILYFGYLTWYKGVDFLIKSLLNQKTFKGKKIRLIIAGGPSFTQEEKSHYKKFLAKIYNLINKAPDRITITGFVKEEDIPVYFAAADLVVFPYRTFISSSGPLSFALAYNKPFLISSRLETILDSIDAKKSLQRAGITKNDVVFNFNSKDLLTKISNSLSKEQLKKLERFSLYLSKERSFGNLSASYQEVLSRNVTRKIPLIPYPTYQFHHE